MNRYCVSCGKKNIPESSSWRVFRCKPCWLAHRDAGGIQRKDSVITSPSGMRVSVTTFENAPVFCSICGGRIRQDSQRVRYVLKRGSECHTCDDCSSSKRFPSPKSHGSTDAK